MVFGNQTYNPDGRGVEIVSSNFVVQPAGDSSSSRIYWETVGSGRATRFVRGIGRGKVEVGRMLNEDLFNLGGGICNEGREKVIAELTASTSVQ